MSSPRMLGRRAVPTGLGSNSSLHPGLTPWATIVSPCGLEGVIGKELSASTSAHIRLHAPHPIRVARSLLTLVTALVILWIMLSPLSTRAADTPADPVRGKQLFEKRCTGCHSLDADKEGPHLRGVYGRKAGTAPGFNYSDALKAANFTWNDPMLEKWLTDTESVVPDNNMDFHVPNPDERADIIGYLKVSSGH